MSARRADFLDGTSAAKRPSEPRNQTHRRKTMNRIYAALAAVSLLASAPAFAKSHVTKPVVAEGAKAEGDAKPAEAKPAEKPAKKTTKKTTKKTEKTEKEAAPEAAPAK